MTHICRKKITEDLASSDELKSYKDEGEEEKRASENFLDDKNDLLFESEQDSDIKKKSLRNEYLLSDSLISEQLSVMGYKSFNDFNLPVANLSKNKNQENLVDKKNGLSSSIFPSPLLFIPPPAHTRFSNWQLNLSSNNKTNDLTHINESQIKSMKSIWPLFNLPLRKNMSQELTNWHSPKLVANMYSNSLLLSGLTYPYLPPTSAFTRYIDEQIRMYNNKHNEMKAQEVNHHIRYTANKLQQYSHIKKPLNAFMIFMKETRQKIMDECTLKESAAINQILGKKWHSLDRSEQTRYYQLAKKEKEIHQLKYPLWSAKDNYAIHTKKLRKKHMSISNLEDFNSDKEDIVPKKCRARYGVDQQNKWCKPCRRKKRCIQYNDSEKNNSPEHDNDSGMDDNFDK